MTPLISQSQSAAPVRPWRRIGVVVFLTSVALNALIAIAVILGAGGDEEWNVLGTSLLLSVASIGAIANAAAFETRRVGVVPILAGAAVLVATTMGIYRIWSDVGGDRFFQWLGTFAAIAVAGTYSGLISLPPLSRRHLWLRWAAIGLAGLLGAVAVGAIWSEDAISGELWGVLGVLVAALTIVIPVMARVDRPDTAAGSAAHASFCALCGARVDHSDGVDVECGTCGAAFSVVIHRTGTSVSDAATP